MLGLFGDLEDHGFYDCKKGRVNLMEKKEQNKFFVYAAIVVAIIILIFMMRKASPMNVPSALPDARISIPGIVTRDLRLPTAPESDDGTGNYEPLGVTGVDGGVTPACGCSDYKFQVEFSTVEQQADYMSKRPAANRVLDILGPSVTTPLPATYYGRRPEWSSWGMFERGETVSNFTGGGISSFFN